MTKDETGHIIRTIALLEGREMGHDDFVVWHAMIGDLDVEAVQAAVVAHYRTSTKRLMPVHIMRRIQGRTS